LKLNKWVVLGVILFFLYIIVCLNLPYVRYRIALTVIFALIEGRIVNGIINNN